MRQARDLELMVKPLSKEGKKPPRQDLSTFWAKVTRAVNGLSSKVDVDLLVNEHIHVLAPIILGDNVYEQFAQSNFLGWEEFMEAVDC